LLLLLMPCKLPLQPQGFVLKHLRLIPKDIDEHPLLRQLPLLLRQLPLLLRQLPLLLRQLLSQPRNPLLHRCMLFLQVCMPFLQVCMVSLQACMLFLQVCVGSKLVLRKLQLPLQVIHFQL
jgi:hypothetical protein